MITPKQAFKNDQFTMLSRSDYLRVLAQEVREASDNMRVLVATMGIDARSALVADLLAALRTAATRGARVNLLIDSYTFLINTTTKVPGPLWLSPNFDRPMLRRSFRNLRQSLRALDASGGRFTLTNQPGRAFTLPQAGRSHIKAAVIGDTFYVGGSNLERPREIDAMVRLHDAQTANWLYDMLYRISESGNVRRVLHDQDQTWRVDAKTNIFVDAGVPDQSVIFDKALAMIDSAKKWVVLTSQYFAPGPGTAALVRALQRGVKVTFYYSHPSMHGPVEGTAHRLYQYRQKHRLPVELFAHQLPKGQHLHAKLLATEQSVMIGSHNYAELGVKLGTAEIVLQRHDPAFAKQAVAFIEQQLAPNPTRP